MKNRVKRKIVSETGASLSIALLVFLVCSVLSAVMIYAVTASNGTMVNMKKTDRVYYNTNSASSAVRELLDGQNVVITEERVTKTTETKSGTKGADDSYNVTSSEETEDSVTISTTSVTDSLLENATHILCYAGYDPSDIFGSVTEDLTTQKLPSFFINCRGTGAGSDLETETVKAEPTLNKDGTLVLRLFEKDSQNSDRYTVKLTFTPSVTETMTEGNRNQEGQAEKTEDAGTFTLVTHYTKTDSYRFSVTWNLTGCGRG